MSLWLCLRFHQLPLQCLQRSEHRAAAVIANQRLLRVNDCAAALGLKEGQGVATARALAAPEPLQLLERDTGAEQSELQRLCCWAYSISPSLYPWRDDCLQLEIGSCLKLHRGLSPLWRQVQQGLANRGYHCHFGLAETPLAAWLLSFTAAEPQLPSTPLEQRLAPLPLPLLADFPKAVSALHKTGCHTLGDVLALPQAALGRRCGTEFLHFLQRLLGQRADLQAQFQPPSTFSDNYWFGYEVKSNSELLPAVEQLLRALSQFLRNTQLCTEQIIWQLVGVDQRLRELPVRSTSAGSDWHSWYQLTQIHLERLQLDIGVEGLGLNCPELRPGAPLHDDLFATRGQREPLGKLLDRLRSRLGLAAVRQVSCRDEHLPELALMVADSPPATDATAGEACAQRPFWLLPEPQTLGQRGDKLHWHSDLNLLYGPERIEDNWWQKAVSRDYYIACDLKGGLFWVFRDRLEPGWYVHGIFA